MSLDEIQKIPGRFATIKRLWDEDTSAGTQVQIYYWRERNQEVGSRMLNPCEGNRAKGMFCNILHVPALSLFPCTCLL